MAEVNIGTIVCWASKLSMYFTMSSYLSGVKILEEFQLYLNPNMGAMYYKTSKCSYCSYSIAYNHVVTDVLLIEIYIFLCLE